MKATFCPRNNKRSFPTRLHAEVRILDLERGAGHPLYSYLCACGWWHLTKSRGFEGLVLMHLDPLEKIRKKRK